MTAYKFRSASQFAFAMDIILNQRLHCSKIGELNDPMEGSFCYSYNSESQNEAVLHKNKIIEKIKDLKICSLSRTIDSSPLWAHYAGGFDGLAVAVNLDDDNSSIRCVDYRQGFTDCCQGPKGFQSAEDILSSRYSNWNYEDEVRIIQNEQFFNLDKPVTKVIVGPKLHPALEKCLQMVCKQMSVPVHKIIFTDIGLLDFPA